MSSPLKETSTESIDELFAKEPTELTDDDIDRICEKLESACELWKTKQAEGQAPAQVDVNAILDGIA